MTTQLSELPMDKMERTESFLFVVPYKNISSLGDGEEDNTFIDSASNEPTDDNLLNNIVLGTLC